MKTLLSWDNHIFLSPYSPVCSVRRRQICWKLGNNGEEKKYEARPEEGSLTRGFSHAYMHRGFLKASEYFHFLFCFMSPWVFRAFRAFSWQYLICLISQWWNKLFKCLNLHNFSYFIIFFKNHTINYYLKTDSNINCSNCISNMSKRLYYEINVINWYSPKIHQTDDRMQ